MAQDILIIEPESLEKKNANAVGTFPNNWANRGVVWRGDDFSSVCTSQVVREAVYGAGHQPAAAK